MIPRPEIEATQDAVNPFTVEIIRSAVVATTDEMKTNLMRTAYTPTVYEGLDFTVALTDPHGNLVSIGLGLPSFIRGISDTVKAMVKQFGTDIHPGDILLTNDSYTHGSHLNHVITALPIFHGDEVVAFSCSEPHWTDIGGVLRGNPTDIFSEGLQLPYLKVYNRGALNKDIISIIQMNVRNPELAMGDFRGQIACVKTGEKRVQHLVSKYGAETFRVTLAMLMDQAERFSRREISKIPEGVYEAEQFMDDDSVEVGVRIPVRVKITVKGDRMTVDLSGVGRQVRGSYNSGAGVSGVQMGFKTLTCPSWFPINDGSFRPLEVILPPGTIVSAQKPSPMRWWMTVPMTVADTMWKAMAQVIPEKVAAGHFADLCVAQSLLIDPVTKRTLLQRVNINASSGGGFGAKHNGDGMPAMICLNDGDTHNGPVEASEAHNYNFGIVIRRELRQDSGGAGKFRGGLGTVGEVIYFRDFMFNSYMERTVCAPWGALGAKSGKANNLEIRSAKGGTSPAAPYSAKEVLSIPLEIESFPNEKHPNAKMANVVLPGGSWVVVKPGGGGGFGNPRERDVSKVLDDVVNEYVSIESAERDYGVAIDRTMMRIDEERTKMLRKSA